MKVIIIKNEEEANKALEDAEKEGLRVACMSNTGLPVGSVRITFLPNSAFKE